MSITRNRELSQFGSFVYIDNNSQEIGIATESTPYVGIGTTNPTVKFHVVGDTNIEGDLTVSNGNVEATSYTLNGTPLVNAALEYWNLASNGDDIYRNIGNLGIGTSAISERLTVDGNISAGQFISTVASGTAPFSVLSDTQVTNLNASYLRGKIPPSGDIVGDTDIQTLSNKTLDSPVLISPSMGSAGIAISGSTSGSTTIKSLSVASGIVTVPSTNDILVARNTTDTLTNKTISASSNTISGLTNSNLSGSAGITNANLANSSISGVSLGSTLFDLTFSSYLNSTGSYDGSAIRTVSVAGTSLNTANTLVARDSSGNFTAGDINCSNLTGSFTLSGKDLNATTSIKVGNIVVIDSSRQLNNLGISTISNVRISSGIITASSGIVTYYGDGSKLSGITATQWVNVASGIYTGSNVGVGTTNPTSKLTVVGVVSATSFSGDGSALTGISSALSYASYSDTIGVNTTGITTSGSTAVTLTGSGKASSISNGFSVTGAGIAPGTTVSSGGGTINLVLSQNAGASSSSTDLTFYSNSKPLSPGSVGGMLCRAWVNFNGTTIAVRSSYNVSSITDLGTGECRVNFTTSMPDTLYAIFGSGGAVNTNSVDVMAPTSITLTTSSFDGTYALGSSSSPSDTISYVYYAVFR